MKRFFASVVAALALFCFAASAPANDLEDFLSGALVDFENPGAFHSQGRGYYTGGGFRVRFPQSTYQPITVQAPSIKAGCSGIDMTFGGFTMLDFDHLVDFLEKTIQSAPAFAFQSALKTLCPACEELSSKLNAIANQFNSLQLNSCATARAAGGIAGKMLGETVNASLGDGTVESYHKWTEDKLDDANSFLTSFKEKMGDLGCDFGVGNCGLDFFVEDTTFIEQALKNTWFDGDNATMTLIRGLMGDVRVNQPPASSKSMFSLVSLSPVYFDDIDTVLADWIGDPESCAATATVNGVDRDGARVSVTVPTLCSQVDAQMSAVRQNMLDRQPMGSTEIDFVGSFRAPIYKVLNTVSVDSVLLDDWIGRFIKVAGYELAYDTLIGISHEFVRGEAKVKDAARQLMDAGSTVEQLQVMTENRRKVLESAYRLYLEKFQTFMDSQAQVENFQTIETRMMAQMGNHPIVGAMVFSTQSRGW